MPFRLRDSRLTRRSAPAVAHSVAGAVLTLVTGKAW
jgi:hypothetical protein